MSRVAVAAHCPADLLFGAIIGETARSHNFSLYDYSRQTNPLLEQRDLLIFNQTTSCTTYTTASVACMLSHDIDTTDNEPLPNYF
ncbi:MAG: sulfatase-like hydrolase/transferase [Gammaproteobacteria bacterium]|nr:sulfatase-like hydrolase/transferase [Gammaproteobacteria bacterium]